MRYSVLLAYDEIQSMNKVLHSTYRQVAMIEPLVMLLDFFFKGVKQGANNNNNKANYERRAKYEQ